MFQLVELPPVAAITPPNVAVPAAAPAAAAAKTGPPARRTAAAAAGGGKGSNRKWTKAEDDILIAGYNAPGGVSWAAVAQQLPGRTAEAVRHRYHENLKPQR